MKRNDNFVTGCLLYPFVAVGLIVKVLVDLFFFFLEIALQLIALVFSLGLGWVALALVLLALMG